MIDKASVSWPDVHVHVHGTKKDKILSMLLILLYTFVNFHTATHVITANMKLETLELGCCFF